MEPITKLNVLQQKIHSPESLKRLVNIWRLKGEKVVFTNGCFDILHAGHATYLAQSAEFGNKLIVAVNSDDSVKRQGKGEDRPVNNETTRAFIIASLHVVDAVIVFDQDTPLELIKELHPDVLTKGADYDADETDPKSKKYVVGSDVVKKHKGKVETIPLVEGFSTTGLISKLKS